VDLVSGQVGRLQIPAHDGDAYALSSALHLPFSGAVQEERCGMLLPRPVARGRSGPGGEGISSRRSR
ncbi:hypothetical protein C5D04_07710, partial [Rathayibacter sp. AY1D2]|uniref:hypothetical protein n=1 Tax=Rathayibacter sp. AY1D2 TaxID=2080543 RepID=UPI000D3FE27F